MTTMKDVARAARVSIATVSASLSGSTYVSPELKQRVMRAVDELGYHRNSIASDLKRGRTSLIGLVVPDVTNPFFTEFVEYVQRDALDAGYTVLLGISNQDPELEEKLLGLMRSHQAAGTILCGAGRPSDYCDLAKRYPPMRIVAVDNAPDGIDADAVLLDNVGAAEQATRHILDFGHTLVAMVAGPQHRSPGIERTQGFHAAMSERHLTVDPQYVQHGDFRQDLGYSACLRLLALRPRPTAMFVANNQMLIGVMRAIAEAGLSVPRDISIASIDDFPWAVAFVPSLTTVRQPIERMAHDALALLTRRIEPGATGTAVARHVHDAELIVRGSCAPPLAES